MPSEISVSTDSGNGLVPSQHQAITWSNADFAANDTRRNSSFDWICTEAMMQYIYEIIVQPLHAGVVLRNINA